MNDKEKIIRDLVKRESLRMIKESQASFLKEGSGDAERVIKDIDDSIIDVNEKKLAKLKNEEESAKDKEDFSEFKRIKEEQVSAIEKLVRGYSKKVELLEKVRATLQEDLINLQKNGSTIFKNQKISEFSNESFQKDWALRIETPNHFLNVVKILDNNAYKVVGTNIKGLQTGDLLMLPDLKIGGGGKVQVYREIGGRTENVANFNMQNITNMIKNPQ
ncbi:MAG: hypothetical protein AABY15_05905 [Nanoarchaeota archaeon]